jgi:hypothetical protein
MSCCICQKTKTTLVCGICHQDLCKSCTEFLAPESLSFLKEIPEVLGQTSYCSVCFTEKVSPELNRYEATLAAAKNILVFDKTQGKETRFIKRKEAPLQVTDCADKNETILRLAFFAVQLGFNAIIDVDLKSRKVKDGRHQHTLWSATAIPAQVTDNKLLKDRSLRSNPN